MNSFAQFVPGIIPKNYQEVEYFAKRVNSVFNIVHIDVVDASYGSESWFDESQIFGLFENFKRVSIHLMVQEPITFLKSKNLKKENTTYLISKKWLNATTISELKNLGYSFGVFFEINDDLNLDSEYYSKLDEILFLLVLAGDKGRKPSLKRLVEVGQFIKNKKLDVFENLNLSLDGGLSRENAKNYLDSGVKTIYGTSFFADENFSTNVEFIKKLQNI